MLDKYDRVCYNTIRKSKESEENKMFTTMYWVLRESDEKTIAICEDKKTADWIAENYWEKCVVRILIKW